MGIEYRIHADMPDAQEGDRLIAQALGGIGQRTPFGWEFRDAATSVDDMPDAMAVAEDRGLYVLLNGGLRGIGAELLGALVAAATARGEVRVEEL